MPRARAKKKAKPKPPAPTPKKKAGRGGARAGAGRKKKVLELAEFAVLAAGELPTDPMALLAIAQRIVTADLQRIITGKADRQVSQEIRATARTIASLTPLERIRQAEGVIKGDRDQVKREGADGAELERADEHTAPIHRRLS
jgi:hypothetical protein